MNLYQVLSEVLLEKIPILDYGEGPLEPYRICEIVAAESRGQAKWTAWKTDKNTFGGCIYDMPKFEVRLIKRGIDEPRGVVTSRYETCFLPFREDEVPEPTP